MSRGARCPIITLTTDFGLRDSFVGVMKGVILSECPRVRIVDITHEVPPGDVRAGAFVLLTAFRFFPRNTVHVAVVDPGVGSNRQSIVARTSDSTFIGPDNGLLSWALAGVRRVEVRQIKNASFCLPSVSATFHGRDIFAPVAARLACGARFTDIGPRMEKWTMLPWPEPRRTDGGWLGEVVYVDQFGNAITNLPTALVESASGSVGAEVSIRGRRRVPVMSFYRSVARGLPVAVPGSSGYIEIAINGGNAARILRIACGTTIRLMVPAVTGVSMKGPCGA